MAEHFMELLCPAGNMDKLKMAIRYGADAVYCAGKRFGLRAGNSNFSDEELKEAVEFVHAHGKKLHVTCNIIPHNEDFEGLEDYLKFLESIGVDAIIVADMGIFSLAKRVAPGLELHVSTQEMKDNVDIEIESFVHGSMCISYSGRCLLSNYMTGNRDANRGQCSQSCRWKYSLVESNRPGEYYPIEEDEHGTYIFNSKDLCLIHRIPDLYEAGIDSLKIEGRMKSVHYCATVAKVYRTAIDTYLKEGKDWYVRPEWIAELEKISHRPYTDGFAEGRPDETAQNYGKSTNTQSHDFIGLVMGYNEEEKYVDLEQRNNFKVGDKVEFCQPKGDLVETVIEKMTDEDGNPIDVAPHAQMKVRIYMDTPLEPYSMMRRECKPKEA